MRKANLLPGTKTVFSHRDWHIIPDTVYPNCFNLKEVITGKILGRFVLPEGGDTTFLNLIGCAPELEDIAEMFRDKMKGNEEEKTMIFSMVMEVLHRICKQ